jgi:hypothetical protein
MRRYVVLALLTALTACAASSGPPADPEGEFPAHAQAVAEAWRATVAGPAGSGWRTGFVPLQDLVLAPALGPDGDLRYAFSSGWYRLAASLPASAPATGTVRFPDGTTTRVGVMGAGEAYAEIDRGDPPCAAALSPPSPTSVGTGPGGSVGAPAEHTCAVLTVTGATLGTASLRTSRGLAEVPAWRFTVAELRGPVLRVAVAPGAVTAPPSPAAPPPAVPEGLAPASGVTLAGHTTLTFAVGTGECQDDPRGLRYETGDAVVVAGAADSPDRGGQEECGLAMALNQVSVTLDRPLGARVVLDAMTGRPLALSGLSR